MEELLAGTVTLHGDTYEIRWLDGDEFADAKIVMGVADLWTAVSDPMGGDLIVDSDIERLLFRARPVCPVSVNDREWKMGRHGSSPSYP